MKKIGLMLVCGMLATSVFAQKKTAGAIEFETSIDPAAAMVARGIPLSDEMKARIPKSVKANYELLFNATNASYMQVDDIEDSNGSGGGLGRMRFFGANGNKEFYYTFADKKLAEVFDLNDTTYIIDRKLAVASDARAANFRQQGNNSGIQFSSEPATFEIVKSDETKKIIGLDCKKVIIKSTRKATILGEEKNIVDETTLWYTTDLGFDFSPDPNLWTEGTVLSIEGRGNNIVAKSIDYRNVPLKDVTAPKKAKPITTEEFKAKSEAMMKRFSGGRSNGGTVRGVVIN